MSSSPVARNATWSTTPDPCRGRLLAEIFEPVLRGLGAAMGEVQHVGIADIEPVDRELEIRTRPDPHAEHVHEPVLGFLQILGLDQKMLQVVKRHRGSPVLWSAPSKPNFIFGPTRMFP